MFDVTTSHNSQQQIDDSNVNNFKFPSIYKYIYIFIIITY